MENSYGNSQSETATTYEVNSRESLIASNSDGVVLKVSDLDTQPLCRICYSGSSKERLIKPCKCKGTVKYIHRRCLERWLEERNIQVCELCQHQFETRRTRKSCWDMLRASDMQSERRNIIGDCTCFAFLTPLGILTFWLCAEGAVYYQKVKNSNLETIALITLAVFLVIAYFSWIILCMRYHIYMFSEWRNRNWNVQIVASSDDDTESSDTTYLSVPSDRTDDSVGITEEPTIRYSSGTEETDPRVTIIGISSPEMKPP